jgi:hypothetical protein
MNRRELVQKILLVGIVLALALSVLESCSKSSAMDQFFQLQAVF